MISRLLLWNLAVMVTGAAILAQPGAASAADPLDEPRTALVRIDDLDLGSAEGQQRLDRRIGTAARRVCGFERMLSRVIRECMAEAKQSAISQLRQAAPVTREADAPAPGRVGDVYSR
ncbi:UrcA family protein [Sphingosinicella sp. BN140058]|uniref:UrcA family protein n=1 Tax=Sphingosinicella sp. BN140058 TaxID=1892855 RepID=UPI0013EAE977|nr:UrcA family protein [Sphingosinicella sp. BN140058]